MPTLTTFLAFDDRAEEAARFYVSVFPRSKIVLRTFYGEAGPGLPGTVMTVLFRLLGRDYVALNGGPHFRFTDAMSLWVGCRTQAEIDGYTRKLIAGGGKQGPCGWVTDRFGVSWQVTPEHLPRWMADANPERVARVMTAMLQMTKLDLAALAQAAGPEVRVPRRRAPSKPARRRVR